MVLQLFRPALSHFLRQLLTGYGLLTSLMTPVPRVIALSGVILCMPSSGANNTIFHVETTIINFLLTFFILSEKSFVLSWTVYAWESQNNVLNDMSDE